MFRLSVALPSTTRFPFSIHDVRPPLEDHNMPPGGLVDFRLLAPFVATGIPLVFEPRRGLPAAEIARALDFLRNLPELQPVP